MSEQTIREILAKNAQLRVDAASIPVDANLFGAGMTSHASVNVMLALEEEFDLEFPDEMLTGEHFNTIENIQRALVQLGAELE